MGPENYVNDFSDLLQIQRERGGIMHSVGLCPEIHYRLSGRGVMITAVYGYDGYIFLPEEIDGRPVTGIDSYAFSGNNDICEEDFVWSDQEAVFQEGIRRICAEEVLEVHLPRYVQEIGRYAFYRCRNMRKLTLHDGLLDIGGGAFTGCCFKEVEIYLHNGERSALKSIVDEIRFELYVKLYYEREGGEAETAELLFPEHYEEAVENTPARILYTSHHGAGGYYRQCFYNRELDYKKYDELLVRAAAEEEEATLVRLSLLRLRYPYKLAREAEMAYEACVKRHIKEAVHLLIKNEDKNIFSFLSENDYWTEEALDYGIQYAGKLGGTEILSVFMDEKHRRFPGKRKVFEL